MWPLNVVQSSSWPTDLKKVYCPTDIVFVIQQWQLAWFPNSLQSRKMDDTAKLVLGKKNLNYLNNVIATFSSVLKWKWCVFTCLPFLSAKLSNLSSWLTYWVDRLTLMIDLHTCSWLNYQVNSLNIVSFKTYLVAWHTRGKPYPVVNWLTLLNKSPNAALSNRSTLKEGIVFPVISSTRFILSEWIKDKGVWLIRCNSIQFSCKLKGFTEHYSKSVVARNIYILCLMRKRGILISLLTHAGIGQIIQNNHRVASLYQFYDRVTSNKPCPSCHQYTFVSHGAFYKNFIQ